MVLKNLLDNARTKGIISMEIMSYSGPQTITVCYDKGEYIADHTNQYGSVIETFTAYSTNSALDKIRGMYMRASRA